MSPSDGCFFSPFHLSGSGSLLLLPHLRLPVHVTLCSLSFLQTSLHRLYQFRSSPFYSVGSSLSGRLAVLVKEGQQEWIFAEFVGSELVQELELWSLPDWGHKVGVVPRPQ